MQRHGSLLKITKIRELSSDWKDSTHTKLSHLNVTAVPPTHTKLSYFNDF